MNPIEALNNLYSATRQLSVNADTHEALSKMYQTILLVLEEKDV